MGAVINYLVGASGTGKTTDLMKRVAEAAVLNPDKKYLMIVPEQAASTVERDMVKIMSLCHGRKGFMNIDIVGISRLAYKIFNEMRAKVGGLLADADKSMIIRFIAGRLKLRVYKNSIDKDGFISEAKSLLSELFQYNITISDIDEVINEMEATGEKPVLLEKLKDIRDIFAGFEEKVSDYEESLPAERLVSYLLRKLSSLECNILDNAVVTFDGFTGYTPAQYDLIEEIMKRAESLSFVITMDSEIVKSKRVVKDYEIFNLSYVTYKNLMEKAKENGLSEGEVLLYENNQRHQKGTMLDDLVSGIFRFPSPEHKECDESVKVLECRNSDDEIAVIAEEIKRLIREEGMRYSDIAVFSPSLDDSSKSFEKIFRKYDIPYFLDNTRKMRQNPFSEAIILLLMAEDKNYDYESIFAFLKTGVISGLTGEEIALIENFVLEKNIKGYRKWSRCFSKILNNEDRYAEQEEVRKKIMKVIGDFHEGIKSKTGKVKDLINAIRTFMINEEYEESILLMADRIEENDIPLARTYRALYKNICAFFDEMENVLGEEEITLREFASILKSGMNEIRIGTIPAVIDSVVIGDTERTRVSDIKVLFLTDMNEGVVPHPPHAAKILSDQDKEYVENIFQKKGIRKQFAPSDKGKLYIEQFYMYLAIAKPMERLYVTYCKAGNDGEELTSAYIIPRIKAILSGLSVENRKPSVFKGTEKTDIYFFAEAFRKFLYDGDEDISLDDAVLYSLFEDKKRYIDQAKAYEIDDKKLTEAAVEAAKKALLVQSVSKLEQYAGCEYKYFLRYMLSLEERRSGNIDQLNFGNVLHDALRDVFDEMEGETISATYDNWQKIKRDEEIKMMKDAITTEFRRMSDDFISPEGEVIAEGYNRYIIENIYQLGERTITSVSEQIRGGDMVPVFYEEQFTDRDGFDRAKVGAKEEIKLVGRIDRADIYEEGDNVYLRILDYKTGNNTFDYSELYNGRQLQLVIYLGVMTEKVREVYKKKGRNVNVYPVGMYYYPVHDPYIKKPDNEDDPRVIEEKISKELRLRGISVDDPFMKEIQEKGISEPERWKDGDAKILPFDFYTKPYKDKKAGDIKGFHINLSVDEFRCIENFAKVKAGELTDKMMSGDIEKNPYNKGASSECDYCSFKSVCRFDVINRDNKINRVSKDIDEQKFSEMINRGGAAAKNDSVE